MNKKIISIIMTAVVLFSFSGCGKDKAVQSEAESAVTNVEVCAAALGNVESTVSYNGDIKSVSTGSVAPKASGAVAAIYAEVGDYVNAGDILMTIDDSTYRLSLSQAQASYNQAQASISQTESAYKSAVAAYENVKNGSTVQTEVSMNQAVVSAQSSYDTALDNYNRQKALFDIGSISQVALDSAKTALDNAKLALDTAKENAELTSSVISPQSVASAQAGVNQAKAAMEQAQAGLEQARVAVAMAQDALNNCKVKAPISGYIASKNVVIGQTAAQGVEAFSIKNPDLLEVQINVTEAVIGSLNIGTKAKINVKSADKENIEGTVSALGETKDAMTGMYTVKISVPGSGDSVKDGMIAEVELTTGRVENVITIPQSAVFVSDDETYVYVAEGETAVKKVITTGMSNEEVIEVVSGLSEGELVITEGKEFLSEKNNSIKITSNN
ncbi:MAG: efflux RND transporter periplasmic adaptor subunit [Clostridia bacterium]|nr:efflux RND transporter periplasmic adaptor subunit [Clostridia bacterium]